VSGVVPAAGTPHLTRIRVYYEDTDMAGIVYSLSPARMVMGQEVWRGDTLVFRAGVTIVCIGAGGKPVRLPAILRSIPLQ